MTNDDFLMFHRLGSGFPYQLENQHVVSWVKEDVGDIAFFQSLSSSFNHYDCSKIIQSGLTVTSTSSLSTHVLESLHLQFCVQFCTPQYRTDILERFQQKAAKMIQGLDQFSYQETLGLFSLENSEGNLSWYNCITVNT